MGALEPPHLIVILVIVLIIFGPGKLPQLGKALGDGIRELKHATSDDTPANDAHARASPPAGVSATRPCRHCQAAVPTTDRFCGVCGASQADDVAVQPEHQPR